MFASHISTQCETLPTAPTEVPVQGTATGHSASQGLPLGKAPLVKRTVGVGPAMVLSQQQEEYDYHLTEQPPLKAKFVFLII